MNEMRYTVRILNNETGELRTKLMDVPWDSDNDEGCLFWWTEGNFGCDCNRQWEFERAAGEPITEDPAPECGQKRFTVLDVALEDGRVLRIDEPNEFSKQYL